MAFPSCSLAGGSVGDVRRAICALSHIFHQNAHVHGTSLCGEHRLGRTVRVGDDALETGDVTNDQRAARASQNPQSRE